MNMKQLIALSCAVTASIIASVTATVVLAIVLPLLWVGEPLRPFVTTVVASVVAIAVYNGVRALQEPGDKTNVDRE